MQLRGGEESAKQQNENEGCAAEMRGGQHWRSHHREDNKAEVCCQLNLWVHNLLVALPAARSARISGQVPAKHGPTVNACRLHVRAVCAVYVAIVDYHQR